MSLKVTPRSDEYRRTNSCDRSTFGSLKDSQILRIFCGWSKSMRMICSPGRSARQPHSPPRINASSIGYAVASEVNSTWEMSSSLNHGCSGFVSVGSIRSIRRFLIVSTQIIRAHNTRHHLCRGVILDRSPPVQSRQLFHHAFQSVRTSSLEDEYRNHSV